MKQNKVDIKQLFAGLQNQMEAQLNTNRENLKHSVTKGDSLENVWIEWLQKYLPNRYCVSKAIIIDSTGTTSEQIDLVIYDQQYTPFVFNQNGALYIPVEGVYAIFEVKPDLRGSVKGKSHVKYAGEKIASVRRLHRTSANIVDRGRSCEPRALTKIIGGILTSVNSIKAKKTLRDQIHSLNGMESIDIGCSVEFGAFYVDYDGNEKSEITDFQKRIEDYYNSRKVKGVKFSRSGDSMVIFFLQLSRYLQQSIGTVAAIDFGAYADNMKFDIDEEI